MPPSSAWIRASTIIIRPPTTHEIIAAGPAAISPLWAPNSQPDPMIEPTEAHIRPISPISRLRANECLDGTGASATDMFVDLQVLPKVWPNWSDSQTVEAVGSRARASRDVGPGSTDLTPRPGVAEHASDALWPTPPHGARARASGPPHLAHTGRQTSMGSLPVRLTPVKGLSWRH